MMDKEIATLHLGGTDEQAARWLGIAADVYREWPPLLNQVMTDRVIAAIIRKDTGKALNKTARQMFGDVRNHMLIEALITRVSFAAVMANLMPQVPAEFERREPTKGKRKRPARAARNTEQVGAAVTG